ncbi:class I SAM-dependent methyltransferase [Rhizobium straminoryzae]|uniref:Class I SAM-dependent methyltransferase n=1 Tax=Rhizobium straminoryzae TaxID=1387186 RepID=A0A549TDI4_9HYPH|nr:class I SAM-dependent methyltransferase [Rhizobium straminoryzae]TRL40114.1 class I SAM-dependent methyltransferase [Rhizobium straminoryzae]
MTDENGWDMSASAWVIAQGENGDFTRQFVLDPVIDAWLAGRSFASALDVGCGEGRFCRRLKARHGIVAVTGIDPTEPLLATARAKDPAGDYRLASAENLPFEDHRFDLTVSYLTLIDIPDIERAIAEMARVTAPGGTLLIANLNPFITASGGTAWVKDDSGAKRFVKVDRYLQEHSDWQAWRGIRILNHHRPLSRYMTLLLAAGLRLTRFDEPPAIGGPTEARAAYNRVPYAHVMEWTKA